jgi:hypothetical protein
MAMAITGIAWTIRCAPTICWSGREPASIWRAPRRDCTTSKDAIGANTCRGRLARTPTPIRNISRRRSTFRAVADRILEIDTRLRGAAVPPDDKIWLRQRGELETLQSLGKCDVVLVADAKELVSVVADLPAEVGIDPAIEQQIDQHLGRIAEALTRRDEILAVLR